MINPVSPVISNGREQKRVAPGAPGGNERKRRGKFSVPEPNIQDDGKPKPLLWVIIHSQGSIAHKFPTPPTPSRKPSTEEQRRETIACSLQSKPTNRTLILKLNIR